MFRFGLDALSLTKTVAIARGDLKTTLSREARDRVLAGRTRTVRLAEGAAAVYGINTGFGPLCDERISLEDTRKLQYNLLVSHAVGVGEPIDPGLSRYMLVGKIHALSRGYSGISLSTLERLRYFLDHDILPVVPSQGSVGASGDLAPLAHLALPLIGLGEFWVDDKIVPAAKVLAGHGLAPLELGAKEGLALINGTQFILAHAVHGLDRMAYLLDLADLTGAMSLEGMMGSAAPFSAALHELRPFAGNQRTAERIRGWLVDSGIVAAHRDCGRVQDPYSLRCIPQVHGASRNAWNHLRDLTEVELNGVTDNPVILESGEAISGGNFHGQPLAMALDYGVVAAAELGNIADRRCYLLLEGKHGLPKMLTVNSGLHSGLMIPQYTTAALVTENKSLCFPASADSIPTSLGQEDHVSMGSISGRRFNQVLDNLEKILAIELLYAAQAIDFRRPLRSSPVIEAAHALVRSKVDHLEEDRLLKDDIYNLIDLVRRRQFDVADYPAQLTISTI